ncbi:MAG TPA: ABC transporter permease [Stellaceae bacterium]|nr:ABC transporter permease [Stellaceae bacterium]
MEAEELSLGRQSRAAALGAGPAGKRGERMAGYGAGLLLLPGFAFILLFFLVPVGLILAQSLFDPAFSLRFYERIFTGPDYLTVLWISLKIAILTTAISLAASYPVAYMLVVARPAIRSLMLAFILLPFWTNVLIRCYAWMLVLQTKGLVNTLLVGWLHALAAPAPLVFNLTGVIIGMVHYVVPINILVLFSVMKAVDLRLVQAAKGLGANPLRAFLAVFVPLTLPGVRAASMLVLVISLGFFVTPALLGGREETTIAILVNTYFTEVLDWGFGSALAGLLLVFTLAGLSLYFAAQREGAELAAR